MTNYDNEQDEISTEPVIQKPSRAERFKRSIAARLRRKNVKELKIANSQKEDREARERVIAKRRKNG